MRLHYYTKDRNFGDQINAWLWERLLPGYWNNEGPLFSAIGTLLGASLPTSGRVIVFSSGVGYGALPDLQSGIFDVACVRGPLSARALGLPAESAVTDGAALLATLEEYRPIPVSRRRGIVFMPHHWSEGSETYRDICRRVGIEYLSPRADSREVVERLANAELVLADAMHAAIVADAMRVPWVPTVSSRQINTFKWLDWTGSLALAYAPTILGAPNVAAFLRNQSLGFLGESHYFAERGSEAALHHYGRQNRLHRDRRKRWLQIKGGHALNRALHRLETGRGAKWCAAEDEKMSIRVSAALDQASKRRPFLSEDAIFLNRLRELSQRLSVIERAEKPSMQRFSPHMPLLAGTG